MVSCTASEKRKSTQLSKPCIKKEKGEKRQWAEKKKEKEKRMVVKGKREGNELLLVSAANFCKRQVPNHLIYSVAVLYLVHLPLPRTSLSHLALLPQ
jgi:hypothetical protein